MIFVPVFFFPHVIVLKKEIGSNVDQQKNVFLPKKSAQIDFSMFPCFHVLLSYILSIQAMSNSLSDSYNRP